MHIPYGSDWPSIRKAGIKVVNLEAQSRTTASRDGYGHAQKGNETVVRYNQRNKADTLEPKGTGSWADM
jgi:hypothetical protein